MAGGVALYERALTYNAKHAKALYNLGVACGEMGHVSRAMFLYELAIHFDSSCAEAWNNLGVLQRDLGNFECERRLLMPGVLASCVRVELQSAIARHNPLGHESKEPRLPYLAHTMAKDVASPAQ